MDETPDSTSQPARRRQAATILALLGLAVPALHGGCTAAQQAQVKAATHAALADAESPAGQAILADVSSAALDVGLDAASGNDAGAIIAGIQGAASAMRDYEGLPVAPSSATVANAAAAGAGVAKVAALVAPGIETIIDHATRSAAAQKVAVSADDITEAAARGLDAVAKANAEVGTRNAERQNQVAAH